MTRVFRNCPLEFGAIFDRRLVVIVPELCSDCPYACWCVPLHCGYVDEEWSPTNSDYLARPTPAALPNYADQELRPVL